MSATKRTRRINMLTDEQKAQMPAWVKKWVAVGLRTGRIDREKAEAAIRACYRLSGLREPSLFVYVDSPFHGAVAAKSMAVELSRHAQVHAQVRDQVGDQVGDQVSAQVGAQVGDQVLAQVSAQVDAQVLAQVGDQVLAQVSAQVRAQVDAQVDAQVLDQVGEQVRAQVRDQVRAQVGAQVGAQVLDQVDAQVIAQVRDQVRAQVGDQVHDQVDAQVLDQVHDQVLAQVSAQVRAQVDAQVLDQVSAQVRAQVGAQVGDQVRDQVGEQVHAAEHGAWWDYFGGQFWVGGWWGSPAYVSFFVDVCGLEIGEKIMRKAAAYRATAEELCWWWPRNGYAIVSERPHTIKRDQEGRLHAEDGPAIAWAGFAIHAWHGVRVPELVIERPHEITAETISGERNAEVRRVMLERFGAARYLRETGAALVHSDRYGVLYRKEIDGDEPLMMVRLLNSTPEPDGTLTEAEARLAFGDEPVDAALQRHGRGCAQFKEYFLRVPPTMRTAHEAVAWTFGTTPDAYAPVVET